jgi:endonuclease-3
MKPAGKKKPQVLHRTKAPATGAAKPASKSKTPAKQRAKAQTKTAAKTAKRAPTRKTASRKRLPRPKITRDQIAAIFARLADQNPEPKGELEHVNAFTLLVAVVLSAQATDAGVNKATRPLFQVADTPEKMLALGEDTVRDYIKTIGLYRNKAKNVIKLSQALIDQYGGEVPEDRDALEELPGVGRKTANVVMNMAFGHPTMAVDTHVFRIANRLGMAPGKTPEQVEEGLLKVVPPEYGLHAHHWLILHGRYVCVARKPKCFNCVIRELCIFKDKTAAP